ncbi:SusC/RagA family TonB-linked outer membrane protein [Flavobacterium sp. RHBU_3]|uniref:SusC/RagA family TonB-linked outer membrane protein n=1 Tax=Flavobacterium sp. RHBU_3 TaxID=3391184 RepID=UPI0039856B24
MMALTTLLKDTARKVIKSKLAGLMFVLFTALTASAQVNISGTVTSAEDGLGLPMATVTVKGTSNSVSTDLDGNFIIKASANDVLVISYIGFANQEITVGNQTTINVKLSSSATQLDDVVVIGYGTAKKSDLTGSVGIVNVENAKKTVTYDVAKQLQGQVAGVTVQSSGEPGGFVNIKIRGISSFNNNNPLFVIDGMITDNPFDFATGEIESIQVLKDASSAAIYGVRGANGVVIITTKKGKAGKINVNYRSYTGFQNVANTIPVTNREQYQQITNAAYINDGMAPLPGNDPTSSYYINNVDTDWQKAAYRTGKVQNQSLTFSGGSESLSYNFNMDYFKNTSYLKTPQAYERYSTTLNLTGKKGKFKYGAKLAYTDSGKENFNSYNGESAIMALLQAIPTMPVYDPNRLGGYGGADNLTQRAITLNVIGWNNLLTNTSNRNRFIGNVWGELEIVKGLKYTARITADQTNLKNRMYVPESDLGWYYITTRDEAALNINTTHNTRTIMDNLVNYEVALGKHKISAMAGFIMEDWRDEYLWSRGVGYDYDEIAMIQYADAISGGEYMQRETRRSYLGKIDYNYNDTYYLTGNFRQDRSSKFAPKNNTGNYYSFAAAYRISNDIKLPEWWDSLKLRGGYGLLGNNTIANYGYSSTVNAFAGYDFNNQLAPGTIVVDVKDPNIKWEDTTTFNSALEFAFFKNKLQFTAEYFVRTSNDLLANQPLPYSTGAFPASITTNVGKIRNSGLEFTLGYSNHDHAFQWDISANVGTLKNEVLKIANDGLPIYGINSITEVGYSAGELYAYEAEGIFKDAADVASHATQPGAQPGDVKFKDVNGDGQITDDDRKHLGRTIPKYTYGFNFNASYKNFDLTMFWQGSAGNYVYNGVYNGLMIGGLLNHHTDELNYWTPDNTDTNVPRPTFSDVNANSRASTRFIQKGDYIRLQNLQLGYNVPLEKNKYIERVRLFAQGSNLVKITPYKGLDPDFNNDGLFSRGYDPGSFPNPRTFTFGVEASF